MTLDPRPRVDGDIVVGLRCTACDYPAAGWRSQCPVCGGDMTEARFGPEGVVWSATVVRVPLPGRAPPYGLAYVDLDDGPRVLAHVQGETVPIGARVRLRGVTRHGDPEVTTT